MIIEIKQSIIALNGILRRPHSVDIQLTTKYQNIIDNLTAQEKQYTQNQLKAREQLSLEKRWQTTPQQAHDNYLLDLNQRGFLIKPFEINKEAFYQMANDDSKIYLFSRRIKLSQIQEPILAVETLANATGEPKYFNSYEKAKNLVEILTK